MAFATSNVRRTYFGNLNVTYGDWTGAIGDTPGTIGVGGGRVYLAEFTSESTLQPFQIEVPVSVSTSGSVSTVTVYNLNTVTAGQFIIIHA